MSKTELAHLAGISAATIDRIERGETYRMETMRKILLALGFTLADKEKVYVIHYCVAKKLTKSNFNINIVSNKKYVAY